MAWRSGFMALGFLLFLALMWLVPPEALPAAEKVKLATVLKGVPHYDMIPLAAEEKGLWKEQALEVEWVPFRGATDTHQAVAAGAIPAGIGDTIGVIRAISRGVPIIMVAEHPAPDYWFIWVLGKGPIKEPRDLKGARIGTSRFGASAYAFGQLLVKKLGIEREVKFVAIGGIAERLAALRAGVIDAFMLSFAPVANLMVTGEIRGLVPLRDYLPKEWLDNIIFARTDFAERSPRIVRGVIKASHKAVDFMRDNQPWVVEKLKANYRFSEEAARLVSQGMYPHRGGPIKAEGLENVKNFLIEYGLLERGKAPAAEKMYTNRFFD